MWIRVSNKISRTKGLFKMPEVRDSCEYIDHCLGKEYQFADSICLTSNHKDCTYYQAMERLKHGSIADVR